MWQRNANHFGAVPGRVYSWHADGILLYALYEQCPTGNMHSVNAEICNLHTRVKKVYSSDIACATTWNASIHLKNLLRLAEVSYT